MGVVTKKQKRNSGYKRSSRKSKMKNTKTARNKHNKKSQSRRKRLGGFGLSTMNMKQGINTALKKTQQGLTKMGVRNITNIEEIKNCQLTPDSTPRLYSVLSGMNNRKEFRPMYYYYMPLDTDTPEVKEAKCNRLNDLREQWIEYKKTESPVTNYGPDADISFDRATIGKTAGIATKSTRYFHFLALKYCFSAEEIPQYCYRFFQTSL